MDFEKARFNMVEQQIRPWNVLNQQVLDLLGVIKREEFVAQSLRPLAFTDCNLPIRINNQDTGEFMFSPKLEARLLQDAEIKQHHKVLEIGTGTGYMAALLAQTAAQVTTVEIKPAIAQLAEQNLKKAGITRVKVLQGCGFELAKTLGTFDVIFLSGSCPKLPESLLDSLKPHGIVVGIFGEEPIMQACIAHKTPAGQVVKTSRFETVVKSLQNAPQATSFVF